MATGKQFLTFFVDYLFFGIEVEQVQEVLRYQEMTRVPLAPAVVRGLINLRGQIVTAIDLRRRLELNEPESQHLPMNVVVRTEDGRVSLLVDEIGDVVEVEEGTFERPPATVNRNTRTLIRGVHKLSSRLMHVLDTQNVLNLEPETQRHASGP
jgi:purine-binding chemotaxis protein CheW